MGNPKSTTAQRRIAAACAGAIAFGLGMLPATAAAAPAEQAAPDLNGDGRPDSAALEPVGDGSQQRLTFTVDGRTTERVLPGDAYAGVQPMRITDVNGDGKQEVLVTESVGANTLTFELADLGPDGGVRLMTTSDGQPMPLHEGGGIAARSGYECAPAGQGRMLITLGATNESPTPTPAYDGSRIGWDVRDGVAAQIDEYPFQGVPQDDPVLHVDPATCS